MILCVYCVSEIYQSARRWSNSGTHIYGVILFWPEFITETVPSFGSYLPSPIMHTLHSSPSVCQLSCPVSACTASSQIHPSPPTVSWVSLVSNTKQCLLLPAGRELAWPLLKQASGLSPGAKHRGSGVRQIRFWNPGLSAKSLCSWASHLASPGFISTWGSDTTALVRSG